MDYQVEQYTGSRRAHFLIVIADSGPGKKTMALQQLQVRAQPSKIIRCLL